MASISCMSLVPLSKDPSIFRIHLPSSSPPLRLNRSREFSLPLPLPPPRVASTPAIPFPPINVDYLEEEFSGHGVAFEGIGDSCVARLSLDNGSTATVMLPSGLVTSYKAPMWHGEKLEILQTFVSEGENGEALIQGGLSLEFIIEGEDGASWSPRDWALSDIRGNSQDSIQVELISCDSKSMVEMKYILTLQEQTLSSEIEVSNTSLSSSVQLRGSIINHLNVSTPDATYALGLEGSSFYSRPVISSSFAIIPPELGEEQSVWNIWEKFPLRKFLQTHEEAGDRNNDVKEDIEGEEEDNYKRLTEEMSMIYTSAPNYLTIIDRGRRNSVVVGRDGLDELYMHSPGSRYEFYSKYAYITLGPSAVLKPVKVHPGEVWRGAQHLHNPNL
ncbi:hypothetical protein SAY86_027781 [Trapa natans]|uniref:NDH-dependent cyclic electron flow 5 n=1 Tax=Trapa natans TaxID=22666 RepID=A0AAN7KM02_TRANT|nr:hypothetical protein SAY86_027781 [Trapa natans]